MQIVAAHVVRQRWTLPGTGAARGVTEREGLVLELRTAGGHVGRGEAAPLPGLSRDTLAEAERGLAAFAARAPSAIELGDDPSDSLETIAELARQVTSSPSARFAIEAAVWTAHAAERARPLAAMLPAPTATVHSLPRSVVVDDADDARRAVTAGARVLKLKVGPGLDLERVIAIARAAPGATLRLDANRSWARAHVRGYLFALAELPVAYVEEPCPDAHELLAEPLPCPIALDESLAELSPDQLTRALASPSLAALVLKPTLLGGFAACLALAARGAPVIVTHTLERDVGRDACDALDAALRRHATVRSIDADRVGAAVATAVTTILATPTPATIEAIHAALDARRPLALLDARLPAAELARQRAVVEAAVLPDDTAAVLFTSGSTGVPRGVALSRSAIEAAATASAAHLGWRDGDRWLLALSTAHAGGLAIVARCHLAGSPIALLDDAWSATRAAALLEGCSLASLVPAQLASLLDDPAWRPPATLRAVLLGGAAAPAALLRAAATRGVPFLATYGLTETFGQLATAPPTRAGDPDAPLIALPGVDLVAGTRDAPAPIRVRGAMLATCYLDGSPIAPELVTADLGFVERGALHVVGRGDDVIITAGHKVHPAMVEAVLTATPGIRAACVFGIPDLRWGQVVGAAIVVDRGFDRERAIASWRDALASHARPRELAFVDELPRLPSGKVDRRGSMTLAREPADLQARPAAHEMPPPRG